MAGREEHAVTCAPYALQAGNLLREALGDLQTSEAILAKDQNLAGGAGI